MKTVMAMISSKLLAASMTIGIPFLTPNFFSMRIIIDGTKTAGETAPRQKPLAKQRVHGKVGVNNHLDITATTDASTTWGHTVSKNMVRPIPLNSSSRPPRINMMERHICLIQSAQYEL